MIMPRPNNKATKIAYKILGKPTNLQKHKPSKIQQKINKRILWEETSRVR